MRCVCLFVINKGGCNKTNHRANMSSSINIDHVLSTFTTDATKPIQHEHGELDKLEKKLADLKRDIQLDNDSIVTLNFTTVSR